ncbi:MAG: sulfatase-like hydrolase/transferase [Gemmatimonadales bacterium]
MAGLLEALAALGERYLGGRLWLFGPDLVWLTPLAEAAVFAVLGTMYALLGLLLRPLARPAVVLTAFGALAALAVLSQIDALHWAAAALLALGIGSAAARAVPEGAVAVRVRRLGLGLAGLVGLAAALVTGSRVVRERTRAAAPRPENASAPNILLLVLDTVRAWNFGWYGYARNTTPFLDEQFADGTVFDRALAAAPWTLPSHASMFTGKPPFALSAGWDRPLDGTERTIAETLRAAGYATGGFVGNFRFTGSSTGLTRGFDAYRDYPRNWAEALRMTAFARRLFRVPAVQVWLGSNRIIEAKFADEVNREFFDWVDGVERPFFGFLNYVDAHSPYLPPAPYDSVWTRAAGGSAAQSYAADVEATFGRGPIPAELLVEYLDGYDGR